MYGLRQFIEDHADALLRSWLRAHADGNEETLGAYLVGEYDVFMRQKRSVRNPYEYPYQAIGDSPCKAERYLPRV